MKKFIIPLLLILPMFLNAQDKQSKGDNLSALLGGMVQSDRWLIHKDQQEEEFIGNVRYKNDIYDIRADRALSRRALQTYTLEGNVFASRQENGEFAQISADKIFYNNKEDFGYALSNKSAQVSIRYKTPQTDLSLFGDRVDFSRKFTLFKVIGDAELGDLNNTLYAGEMSFDMETGVFEAYKNRPVFFGFSEDGDYALQADKITAQTKEGFIKAQGNVQGWLTSARDWSGLGNLMGGK